jgi:hypothetical protein
MLKRICGYNDAEKQKFEFDWNECYLLIGEQVAQLDNEKNRLAAIKEGSYKVGKMKEKMVASIHNFIHSSGLKYGFIALALVFALWIVPAYIYSYRQLKDIPVVSKIYYFVADKVFRPFLNSDYAYDRWEDIGDDPGAPHERHNAIGDSDSSKMTIDNFKSSVLAEIGMSKAASDEAKNLIDQNLNYEKQRFSALGQDVRLYYVLFKDTEDAKKFMDLENTSLKDPALPADAKQKIADTVYIKRMANLVAIGISNHQMRRDQIIERFGLNADKNGENDLKVF